MRVELIWRRGCPNVVRARANLMRAFARTGLKARWREWCADDAECPEHARAFGSPTIVVDGRDVAGLPATAAGPSCRLYRDDADGWVGAPSPSVIAAKLHRAHLDGQHAGDQGWSWRRLGAAAPSLGVALLPKIACPACWPAYAGVLSSLGIPFLIDSRYLLALTVAFVALALFSLGFRASRRRGLGPLVLGAWASGLLLVGKFHFESDPAMFGGVALLVAASLWNSWPRKLAASSARSPFGSTVPNASCCDTARSQPRTPTA